MTELLQLRIDNKWTTIQKFNKDVRVVQVIQFYEGTAEPKVWKVIKEKLHD